MVSAYLTAIILALVTSMGVGMVPVALIITMAITILITAIYGWAIERVAYRPLRGSTQLAPLISAIGMSLILESYVRRSARGPIPRGFRRWSRGPSVSGAVTHSCRSPISR